MSWPPLVQAALDRSNKEPTRSFVYFVLDHERGAVKIGKASDPHKRLRTLQTAAAGELELVGLLAGGKGLERELHEHFASSRLRGEWFKGTAELRELILAAFAAGKRQGDPPATTRASFDTMSRAEQSALLDEFSDQMGIARSHAPRYMRQLLELREDPA